MAHLFVHDVVALINYRFEYCIFIDIFGVAALALKRPVNLVFTREETFAA